jgi:hypothetical protein
MKQSEAVLIPALLSARVPRPVVEEANIEGVRMLVIIGNEVDTVIRYNRGGGSHAYSRSRSLQVGLSTSHSAVMVLRSVLQITMRKRRGGFRQSSRQRATQNHKHWPSGTRRGQA